MVIGIDASRANIRERTGTEKYSFYIIRHLIARDRRNRYVLYTEDEPLPDIQALTGPNVTIRVLRWPPRFLWSQLRLSVELLLRRPDVLFVPAHTIPLIHPRRTITTIHDLGFERNVELYDQKKIGGGGIVGWLLNIVARMISLGKYGNSELDYHRWSARYAATHAHQLITVSNFSRQEILDHYHPDPQRLTTIYHGLDREQLRRPSDESIHTQQRACGITGPYLVYVGRLEKKKNILDIVQSFALARTVTTNLELVLIGKVGMGWDEAVAFISQNNLLNAVHVLGWQPNDVTTPLVAGARALVLLSEYEGFGLPVLETYALGTPVIAASRGSLPEVAGDAACMVDPHDHRAVARAIERVCNDVPFRETLIARGHIRTAAFSWDRAAEQTLAVLER